MRTPASTPCPALWPILLVGAGSYGSALLGVLLTRAAGDVSSLWVANAVLIAGLVMQPARIWPWLIAAFVAANAGANGATGDPVFVNLGFGAINAGEALLAAILIRRRCGPSPNFETLQQMSWFAAAAGLIAPVASATAGATLIHFSSEATYARLWLTWFLGASLGNLTLAPLLILLAQLWQRVRTGPRLTAETLLRGSWPVLLVAATSAGIFSQSVATIAFLALPVALLATLRLGPTGAALSAACIILIGGLATVNGRGPMALMPTDAAGDILVFQIFVAAVLSSTLPVAALRAEREGLAAMLQTAADSDSLTGLPNRRALYATLDETLDRAPPGREVALLLVDLDRFKAVNDRHGHQAGDRLLKEVASRLMASAGPGALPFRLGGDEFAVLCLGGARMREFSEQIGQAVVRAMADPVYDGTLVHHIGASVGIAHAPDHATDRQALLRSADMALYRAKEEGRGRVCVFHPGMDAEILRRTQLEEELTTAVRNDELRPVYQPVVSLRTGKILAYEMLARWPRADGQSVGPDVFMPLAESSGLINDLTVQLLSRACRDSRQWEPSVTLAINVAPIQLGGPTLLNRVLEVLAQEGFPPTRLSIEIMESALNQDPQATQAVVEAFHQAGIRVALDDFGTGYSSLHHLRMLPFDTIKIDRSFVQQMEFSPEVAKIVRGMISLAISLDLPVVAEGIESEAVAAELLALGCEQGQGYRFGRPTSADALAEIAAPAPAMHSRGFEAA